MGELEEELLGEGGSKKGGKGVGKVSFFFPSLVTRFLRRSRERERGRFEEGVGCG